MSILSLLESIFKIIIAIEPRFCLLFSLCSESREYGTLFEIQLDRWLVGSLQRFLVDKLIEKQTA